MMRSLEMSSIERQDWTLEEHKPRRRLSRTVIALAAATLLVSGCEHTTDKGADDDKDGSSQDESGSKKPKKESAPFCKTIAQKIRDGMNDAGYDDPGKPRIVDCDKEHVLATLTAGIANHPECEVNIRVTDYNKRNGSPSAWQITGFDGYPVTIPNNPKGKNVISIIREGSDPDLQLRVERCVKSPV